MLLPVAEVKYGRQRRQRAGGMAGAPGNTTSSVFRPCELFVQSTFSAMSLLFGGLLYLQPNSLVTVMPPVMFAKAQLPDFVLGHSPAMLFMVMNERSYESTTLQLAKRIPPVSKQESELPPTSIGTA